MEYPKINSLWKREGWYFDQLKKRSPDYQRGRQSFIIGDYAEEEFANIKRWRVDEKIDGTNMRISFEKSQNAIFPTLKIDGRTSNAQIPCHLFAALQDFFGEEKFLHYFQNNNKVTLFGEGYGPKIQACGGNYRKDAGFILFDIFIDGWWLARDGVKQIASELGINMVPEIAVMSEGDIVDYVKSKPLSICSDIPQVMEGVMCRSEPLVLFRNHKPVMFKLKCKEF